MKEPPSPANASSILGVNPKMMVTFGIVGLYHVAGVTWPVANEGESNGWAVKEAIINSIDYIFFKVI